MKKEIFKDQTKKTVTMDYAEFVCTLSILNKKYALYSLGRFFIEHQWDYPNMKIIGINAFNSDSEFLDKYNNLKLSL